MRMSWFDEAKLARLSAILREYLGTVGLVVGWLGAEECLHYLGKQSALLTPREDAPDCSESRR